ESAREQGARLVAIDRVGPSTSEFNLPGLGILTRLAGLEVAPDDDYGALGPRDIYITTGESEAEPCGHAADGTPIYFQRGGVQPVDSADNLVCPPRSDQTYAAPGDPRPDPAAMRALRAELAAAREQGVREVYFQETVASSPLFGGGDALAELSGDLGLREPRDGRF